MDQPVSPFPRRMDVHSHRVENLPARGQRVNHVHYTYSRILIDSILPVVLDGSLEFRKQPDEVGVEEVRFECRKVSRIQSDTSQESRVSFQGDFEGFSCLLRHEILTL